MAQQVGSRRSLIVSLILTIAIAFGSLVATLSLGWGPKLGLDLAGGLSVVYKPATHASTADLQEVVTILNNRVNGLGVSGATVNLQGTNVVVSVPGRHRRATDPEDRRRDRAAALSSGALSSGRTDQEGQDLRRLGARRARVRTCGPNRPSRSRPNNSVAGFSSNSLAVDPAYSGIKTTAPNADIKTNNVILPLLGSPGTRYLLGPSELTGQAIGKAVAQQDTLGAWVVNYTLTKKGSPKWDAVAQKNFHQALAIELDGVIQSAPLIQPAQATFTSFDGTGEISGSFTEQGAKNLAIAMEFGALPVRLNPLNTVAVSPTLGHSSLVAGLGAGLVGLLLVLLYTILYYRALGLVIVLGLAATAALLWAIISALGHTSLAPSFDLAGITGIIVSIGITVDSYIVYFERLKDEARAGRSVRTSVDRGFRSAWRTVLAADTVSLLAAILLYLIAVGDVRGFAFFLGLSTLMDVFMTWYFTRPLVILLGRRSNSSTSALSMAAGLTPGVSAHE